jgi:tight adherence protein B
MTVLGGLTGGLLVLGIVLIVVGLRRAPRRPGALRIPRRWLAGRQARRAGAAVGLTAAVWVVTGWPVAGVAAGLAAARPFPTGRAARARQVERLEALAAWTRRLADVLSSGAGGLERALAVTAQACPPAIAGEVRALAGRLPVEGAEGALRAFADDLSDVGSAAADLVAAALILRVRRGGRGLRPVLDALSSDLGDLVRAQREVEADRAKPRSNIRALIAITLIVLTATVVFARDYLAPFGSPPGQVALAGILAVFGLGLWLATRIGRPERPTRFLVSHEVRR